MIESGLADNLETATFHSRSADETADFGARLGKVLKPGDIVGLVGALGTGKTIFVKGICRALGVSPKIAVRSPTYTIINDYPATAHVRHADLYRIDTGADIETIGLFDTAIEGVTLIEWADKLPPHEIAETVKVKITEISESDREIAITAKRKTLTKAGLKS